MSIKKILIIVLAIIVVGYGLLFAMHFLTNGVIPLNCFQCHG
ncbi:MAG: hypothetical protein ACFFDR_07340 [Candidatus Thorarchaeota archaeon]